MAYCGLLVVVHLGYAGWSIKAPYAREAPVQKPVAAAAATAPR